MKWFLMSSAALVLGVTLSGAVLAKGNPGGQRSQPHYTSHCQPTYHQSYCPAPAYQQPVKHDSDDICFREEDHPEWSCRWWSEEHHCWFFWYAPMKTWYYWCNNCHKFYPMSAMEHMPPTGHEPKGYESLPLMGPDGKVGPMPRKDHDDGPPGKTGHEDGPPAKAGHDNGPPAKAGHDDGPPGKAGHDDFKPGPDGFKSDKGKRDDGDGRRPDGDQGLKPGKDKLKDGDGKHGPQDTKQTETTSKDDKGLPPRAPGTDNGPQGLYKGPDVVPPGVTKPAG